jgi:transposase
MAEGDLLMSGSERDRGHVVRQVLEHRLGQREASERLGIGVRQLKRLVRSWQRQGDAGLVSRQRGRASHNRLPEALRTRVMALPRDKYPDFGPTWRPRNCWRRTGSRSRARPSARCRW